MGHGKSHPPGKVPNHMDPHSRMSQTTVESMMGGPASPGAWEPMLNPEKPKGASGFRIANARRKMNAGKIKGGGY